MAKTGSKKSPLERTAEREKKTAEHGKKLSLKWYNFIFLTIAGIINSVGVTLFLAPWAVLDGGFSGTSFLIFQQSGLPMFIWLLVLNIPFFLLAWKRMGFSVIIYSIWAIGIYSLTTFVFQNVLDIKESPFLRADKEYNIFLAAIFGGLISGIGSGLTIRFGGAMDGVEVLGVMFAKRVGLTVGQFVMAYNIVLYILAGGLMGEFEIPLYSILAYMVGLKVVDFIVDGLDKAKAAMIITDHSAEVAEDISNKMGCGITILNAKGYYSKEAKVLLYCVVSRFEISALKSAVAEIDPNAFISVTEVSDMMATQTVRFKRPRIFRRRKKSSVAPKSKIIMTVDPVAETDGENLMPNDDSINKSN